MSRSLACLLAVLLFGCGDTSDTAGPPDDTCNCVWEGPVEYRLERAWSTADALYAEAHLAFLPCCGGGSSETLQLRVDLDGSTERASVPAGADEISLSTGGEVCAAADAVSLLCEATDSVYAEQLEIGTVTDKDGTRPVVLLL